MSRLLLLFEHPTLHGGERSWLGCLPSVRAAGFEPLALAPGAGDLASALAAAAVEVHEFSACDGAGNRLSQADRRQRLETALRRLRPALVHANSLAMSRLAGPVTADAGVPSLGHLRDIVSLSRQAVADVNRHSRLLAVSEATRAWHVARGLPPDKVFVCYNGVDGEQFSPRPATGFLHAELSLPRTAQLAGSIGQVIVRKGLDVTLEAMRRLAPDRPHLHWIVVGERFSQKDEAEAYERRLHDEARCPPLAGRVHFLGMRRDVPGLLNELTLLLHAARQEPLGRVLLEAAASGLPTIATEVGGTAEILPRAQFAELLVPPDHAQALATATARLLDDPRRRADLGAALRQRATTVFSLPAAAERLVAHYRDLCAQN